MEQLLRIETKDIKLDYDYESARLECETDLPTLDIVREKGGLDISYTPGKLKMDTYEARCSLGNMNIFDLTKVYADKGVEAARNAASQYAQEGNMMMNAHFNKNVIADIAEMRADDSDSVELVSSFLPNPSVQFEWEPQELSMQYEADRLQFNWRVNSQVEMNYIPASLEFYVEQYPSVDIEYLGDMLYVPPSANPEYEADGLNILI